MKKLIVAFKNFANAPKNSHTNTVLSVELKTKII
jgi:hypothetical protein